MRGVCLAMVAVLVCALGMTRAGATAAETSDPCGEDGDVFGCLKQRVFDTARGIAKEDNFQVTDSLSIVRNSQADAPALPRSASGGLFDLLANYIQTHDVIMKDYGTTLTMTARGLDEGKVDVSLKANQDEEEEEEEEEVEEGEEGRGSIKKKIKKKIKKVVRKSKLRKLIVPVVIVLLLKAITLIPLLIGVLGVKTWNALQLGFGSFLVSFALGIFQLCTKLTDVFPKPAPIHPWMSRELGIGAEEEEEEPQLAYRGYEQH